MNEGSWFWTVGQTKQVILKASLWAGKIVIIILNNPLTFYRYWQIDQELKNVLVSAVEFSLQGLTMAFVAHSHKHTDIQRELVLNQTLAAGSGP